METERVIGNDWVVRYENRFLQVNRQGHHWAPAKGKVAVCEWPDGRLEIRYRGQRVQWEEIAERPRPVEGEQPRKAAIPYGGTPPKASHPWRQRYDGMPEQSLAKHQIQGSEIVRAALALRPKRSAYGLAGLRFGSRPNNRNRTNKRDTSNELRQGTF